MVTIPPQGGEEEGSSEGVRAEVEGEEGGQGPPPEELDRAGPASRAQGFFSWSWVLVGGFLFFLS